MSNNINVSIEDLKRAITNIYDEIDSIEKALGDAEKAGDKAISALGGAETPSGSAVSSKMVSINLDEFEKTKTSIHNFLDSLIQVGDTYQQLEDEFVSKINSYDPSSQG